MRDRLFYLALLALAAAWLWQVKVNRDVMNALHLQLDSVSYDLDDLKSRLDDLRSELEELRLSR